MSFYDFLNLIWRVGIVNPILEIIFKFQFYSYKFIYYKYFKKGFTKNNLNVVGYDPESNQIWLKNLNKGSNKNDQEVIMKYAEANEKFKTSYGDSLELLLKINKTLVPALKKYYVKALKQAFKNNLYIGDALFDLNAKSCTFKYNKLVDKIIVPKIKKMKIVRDKESNENIKLFLMDQLIDFSKIKFDDIPAFLNVDYESLTKNDDPWHILGLMIINQLDVGCYIAFNLIVKSYDSSVNIAKNISKNTLNKLKLKNPDIDFGRAEDITILDSVMKLLNEK